VRDAAGRVIGRGAGRRAAQPQPAFIDHINEIVYPAGALPFGSRGTATLFLDDVRISTNVRLFTDGGADGSRAIGTRVSHGACASRCWAGQHLAGPRLRRQRLVRVGLPAAGRRRRPARGHALRRLPGAAVHLAEVRRWPASGVLFFWR
jgi:hypothetical protein